MRCLCLATILTVTSIASAQDTSVRLTYFTRAARASVVIKELGQLAKINLQTSPQTASEILLISVKDQPLSEIMSRIATVTSGEWKREGTVYRLVANLDLRMKEERADLARKVIEVQRSIEYLTAAAKKQLASSQKDVAQLNNDPKSSKLGAGANSKTTGLPTKTQVAEDTRTAVNSTAQLAMLALINGIDPKVLAQIGPTDRLVFSTDPTRMQRNLGGDASDVVNDFIQKHNEQIANIRLDPTTDNARISASQIADSENQGRAEFGTIGPISKAIIVASRQGYGDNGRIHMRLRLFNAKGATAFSTTTMLTKEVPPATDGTTEADPSESDPGTVRPNSKKTQIQYSDDTKALIVAMRGPEYSVLKPNLSQGLRRKLFLPNEYDPLSFVQTDELLAYARQKRKPLVADIPDDWSVNAEILGSGEISTLEDVEQTIADAETIKAVHDDGYTVVMPASPPESRAIRANRPALAALMHAAEEKGLPSLNDFVAYALHCQNPNPDGVFEHYFMLFLPGGTMETIGQQASWEVLRFYGRLSLASQANLGTGGKILIGSLTPDQKSELLQMTYGSSSLLTIDANEDGAGAPAGFEEPDYRDEPTEEVPNGLPPEGYLELRITSEAFASPQGASDLSYISLLGALGPEDLAAVKLEREAKDAEGSGDKAPLLTRLRIGDRAILDFTFHITSDVVIQQSLWDHLFQKNAPLLSENNLPASFQKQISDAMALIKNSQVGPGQFGRITTIHP